MSKYSEYNKKLTVIFDELFYVNQFYFQLIVILILVTLNYYVNGTNKKNPFQSRNNDKLLLVILAIIFILAIILDWNIWHDQNQTMLFSVITLCLSLYIYQQHINFNNYMESFRDLRYKDHNRFASDSARPKDVKNVNVMDYVPDDIKVKQKLEPYVKGGEYNQIKDTTLGYLPVDKIPNPRWHKLDTTVRAALGEHERRRSQPPVSNILFKKQQIGAKERSRAKWGLDRYYPLCSQKELDNLNKSCGGDCEGKPGSMQINQYCTNLPDVKDENLEMVSGNNIKQIRGRSDIISAFPRQHDIGGQGIVDLKKEGKEIISDMY